LESHIIAVQVVLLADQLFSATILLCLYAIMSFNVESFISSPKLSTLVLLKKTDLVALAQHYKLDVTSTMMKCNIWKMLMEYLMEEEIVSDKEDMLTSTSVVELKKLELKDKEKVRVS